MILLIDWGNTQLKFIKCDSLSKSSLDDGELFNVDNIEQLDLRTQQEFELILISSVRGLQENEQLCSLLKTKSQHLFFAKTSSKACEVSCAYDNPDLLGIDRWLGILAVESASQSVGLVSIGTAITLDVVSNKKHLGGHILPGRQLMFDSLFSTGQVRPELSGVSGQTSQLGCSTSECVNYAVDTAIYGYLFHVMQSMQKQHQVTQWVLTGGGGNFWANKLLNDDTQISFEPLAVFNGLTKLYLDNQKK